MGQRFEGLEDQGLTVDHLTASLANIEQWCRAVRQALDSIPDKDSIRFPDTLSGGPVQAQHPKPKQKAGECPPPESSFETHPVQAQHPKPKQKAEDVSFRNEPQDDAPVGAGPDGAPKEISLDGLLALTPANSPLPCSAA